ncbi:MAG TPA: DUF2182 domain-containing protein, partial [Gammaproteobacteria bacterium]|nr:DUF2182 domain-containing protein [Gammaproteobacteria bacterium]
GSQAMRCCEQMEDVRELSAVPGPAAPAAGKGEWPFLAVSALLFVSSAGATAYCGDSMSGGMEMPGGWTLSMAWMRMPGQSWPGAAALFLGMWLLMMAAMMLPALVPMLLAYHHTRRPVMGRWLTAGGYLGVWLAFGALAYLPGVLLAALALDSGLFARCVPALTGIAVVFLGVLQMTEWKLGQLTRCRAVRPCATGASQGWGGRSAWAHGLQLGLCCLRCNANLMLVQLVAGVMDLKLMALLTLAISAERLAPAPRMVARAVGLAIVAAGAVMFTADLIAI